MDRRKLFIICALAAGLWGVGGCVHAKAQSATQKLKNTRPNIILVMTDDQGYGDLSCHGNPVLKTPHLDSLYDASLRFTNFHVSPTCAPTRSALMSGRHEFKNGVTHTILERERMTLDAVTLPQTLKKAGYATGIFGKWHLGDEDAYQPENRGFDEVFIHGGGGIGQKYPGSCADVPPNQEQHQKTGYFNPVMKHNGMFVQTHEFCTDAIFRQAMGWINQQRRQNKPFFAYIPTNAPHGPYYVPEKYLQRFLDQGLPGDVARFYAMIENIDDNMGLLMAKMSECGLDENTLLIFMTDNGTAAGEKIYNAGMKGKKGTPDEGGTRVPAFFCWKNTITPGVDVDRLAAHIDIFPTLAELTGAPLPQNRQVEGRNLVPLLESPQADWDDRFLFTHRGRWEKGSNPDKYKYEQCAVRSQRFRFVNNKELYDMKADPGQKVNVIDQYPDVVKKMRAAYDQWWAETRPLMINEDAEYAGSEPPFFLQYKKQQQDSGVPDWMPPAI